MEGIEERTMDGRAQILSATGRNALRAQLIEATVEVLAEGSSPRLSETGGTARTA